MEVLFYFTKSPIELADIEGLAREAGYRCRFLMLGPVDYYVLVYYQGNDVWKWRRLQHSKQGDFFELELAQLERISELQPSFGCSIEYRTISWPRLLPLLKLLLVRFGGWVGCDDGTFERLYTAEDIEQLEHPFEFDFKRASPLPTSKPGDRIVLDPSIPQPEKVLDLKTYKKLLKQAKHLRAEDGRLWQAMRSYPIEELSKTPEYRQRGAVQEQFRLLIQEYRNRLPIHLLAQCPYCGVHILQPVDSFSLMGFDPSLKAAKAVYGGELQWLSPPPRQRCPHALCVTLSVNLNGPQPDDLSGWMLWKKTELIDSAPYIMVWPLIARYTSAVLHALPIGRLDDRKPIHHYTAYFVTYFVDNGSNLHTQEMWVPNDWGGPALGLVQVDIDLIKWVKAGRLFWLNPDDPSQLMRGTVEAFPYANVEPKGWYYILEGGRLDGPHPYYQVWQGEAPPHDESFPKSIEHE